MYAEWSAYLVIDRRAVECMQKKVVKQGKRNAASRLFHAKSDKDAIAAWKQDLARVLHIFNVRSVYSPWHSLTSPFQTELAINTHILVTEIHGNALANREGARGKHRSVSVTSHLSWIGYLLFPRAELGQQ